jgi:hypothetical protein
VPVEGKIADELLADLRSGPIVDDKGRRFLTEAKVGAFGGFRVDIFADEHPPPHFRVQYAGQTANYRISDGAKINGGLDRFQRNIHQWYLSNRDLLISKWNTMRPSDCPVGVFRD